jgi:hypothetical protein
MIVDVCDALALGGDGQPDAAKPLKKLSERHTVQELRALGGLRVQDSRDLGGHPAECSLTRCSAGLRPLCFHDLHHTFGTQMVSNPAISILQLKAYGSRGHRRDDEVPALRATRRRGRACRGGLLTSSCLFPVRHVAECR